MAMFRRWMILLAILLVVSISLVFYFHQQFLNSWEVSDTCGEYLDNLPDPDTWSAKDDRFWMKTCDSDWQFSDYMLERDWRDFMKKCGAISLFSAFGIFCSMVVSLIGRWVVKG